MMVERLIGFQNVVAVGQVNGCQSVVAKSPVVVDGRLVMRVGSQVRMERSWGLMAGFDRR